MKADTSCSASDRRRWILLAPLVLLSLLVLPSCERANALAPEFENRRTDATEPPRDAPPSEGRGQEPAGYTTITDRAFTALDDAGWGYNASPHISVVNDDATPGACCSAVEARYPRGWAGGSSPMVTWHEGSQSREIYISFHLKLSDNWQGHESGVNKLGFVWIHDDASVYFSAQGSGDDELRPRIRLQAVPEGARNLAGNRSDASVKRGQWHRWEVQLISNTPGTPDGVARIWLDGELISEYKDILFSDASQDNVWQHVYWYPVWGGMQDSVREDMALWISDYYASGR